MRERAIVLCPTGRRISTKYAGSYYYPDHLELGREFVAMVKAARERFGARILPGAGIYTGFSSRRDDGRPDDRRPRRRLSVPAPHRRGDRRVLERGARSYKASGGRRVEYVCGGRGAGRAERMVATPIAQAFRRRSHVSGGGHTDDGRVGQKAAELFEVLLAEAVAQGGRARRPARRRRAPSRQAEECRNRARSGTRRGACAARDGRAPSLLE